MTRFKRIKFQAKLQGIVVERVGGSEPYRVYLNSDHGSVAVCCNLREVQRDVDYFASL